MQDVQLLIENVKQGKYNNYVGAKSIQITDTNAGGHANTSTQSPKYSSVTKGTGRAGSVTQRKDANDSI